MAKEEIIISLTSYPKRIDSVAPCVMSLLAQKVRADKVMLWLGEDDFPNKEKDLPKKLLLLTERGLDIRWCEKSLYSHDKYFWIMQEQPDAVVITVDDDICYQKDLIATLLEQHEAFPNCVISNRQHRVLAENGTVKPYEQWAMQQRDFLDEPRMSLLSTGIAGILYPSRCFPDSVFDAELINELCPRTDDIWLFIHELLNDISVVATKIRFKYNYVPGTQENGLFHENVKLGGNDSVLSTLFEKYPQAKEKLMQAIADDSLVLTERAEKDASEDVLAS